MKVTANATMPSSERSTYQIRALERGLDLLEAFTPATPECSVAELAAATGLPKPTIVRLLSVLASRSYIERVADSDRYRLGVKTLEIGSTYLQGTSLEAEAKPIMKRLADQTNQTANLGILDQYEVVHIQVVAPDRPVRFWADVGKREDAYLSGLGKVLLSGLNEAQLERYLAQPRTAKTPHTLTGAAELRHDIERTRQRGYGLDDEESNVGVRCVAAPIRDFTGAIVAAVSISGARAEFEPDQMQRYIAAVTEAAAEISTRLGSTRQDGKFAT